MTPQQRQLAEILLQALGEPVGLRLRVSDQKVARQQLYAARRAAGDADLARLQIRADPRSEAHLVIVKGPPKGPLSAEDLEL